MRRSIVAATIACAVSGAAVQQGRAAHLLTERWQLAIASSDTVIFADASSVTRTGDRIRFQADIWLRTREDGADHAMMSIEADCRAFWQSPLHVKLMDGDRVVKVIPIAKPQRTDVGPTSVERRALEAVCEDEYYSTAISDRGRVARKWFASPHETPPRSSSSKGEVDRW